MAVNGHHSIEQAALSIQNVTGIRDLQRQFPDLTPDVIAGHVGMSTGAVRSYLKEQGRSGPLDRALLRFRQQVSNGEISLVPTPAGSLNVEAIHKVQPLRRLARGRRVHYSLEITQKVWTVLDFCSQNATLGLIWAMFGSGKTHAVREWIRRHQVNTIYLEFNRFLTGNVAAFITALADALGIEQSHMTAHRTYLAVVQKLRDEPALLIFDQCEGAQESVLQVIRHIWDDTHHDGVGVVLLGAQALYDRLYAGRGREIGALVSRIRPWAGLSGITRGEMVAVLKAEGVTDIDAAAIEAMWRAVCGSCRTLFNAMEMIRATHDGRPLREADVAEMVAMLRGTGGGK